MLLAVRVRLEIVRNSSKMYTSNRRVFLRSGITLASALVLRAQGNRVQTRGTVDLRLEARQDWIEVGGRYGRLYAFNGQIPGPVIEAYPGDEVKIALLNRLPETTNLHFHGLHVPSTGNADNVMLRVPPQETLNYSFTLPSDHPAGTFWYHPHVHGSAARQVSRGLAGVFIVRGEIDQLPEIQGAPESVLVLQDFDLDAQGEPLEPGIMEKISGREGRLITVSGRVSPRINIQSGGWIRLRIVNASSSRIYRMQIEEHPFYVIGTDGGFLTQPAIQNEILLAPGERIDVMLKGDRPPGDYHLQSLPYNRGSMGMGMAGMVLQQSAVSLATLQYEGQAEFSWNLPSKLADIDPLPRASVRRQFQLGSAMGMSFSINGRTFSEDRVDTRAVLGAIEDWEFLNPTGMDHPMHIHTNPFQLLRNDGSAIPAWKDTVLVPARSGVAVRTMFRDFEGISMYHCHILDHEDLGMMAALEIKRRIS